MGYVVQARYVTQSTIGVYAPTLADAAVTARRVREHNGLVARVEVWDTHYERLIHGWTRIAGEWTQDILEDSVLAEVSKE